MTEENIVEVRAKANKVVFPPLNITLPGGATLVVQPNQEIKVRIRNRELKIIYRARVAGIEGNWRGVWITFETWNAVINDVGGYEYSELNKFTASYEELKKNNYKIPNGWYWWFERIEKRISEILELHNIEVGKG